MGRRPARATQKELSAVIQRLEERGARLTPSRLGVLAAVADAGDQFSAEEIAGRLRGTGRATVFRTLKLLVEMDVLCRVLLDDGSLRYRWSRRGHHHHLVCVACGGVQDFTACDMTRVLDGIAGQTDFVPEGHWLEVYGHCAACRAETAEPERTPAGVA